MQEPDKLLNSIRSLQLAWLQLHPLTSLGIKCLIINFAIPMLDAISFVIFLVFLKQQLQLSSAFIYVASLCWHSLNLSNFFFVFLIRSHGVKFGINWRNFVNFSRCPNVNLWVIVVDIWLVDELSCFIVRFCVKL